MIVAAGAFALLFVIEWRLALAGCLIVPMAALLIARYGRRIRRASAGTQDDLGRLGGLLSEQVWDQPPLTPRNGIPSLSLYTGQRTLSAAPLAWTTANTSNVCKLETALPIPPQAGRTVKGEDISLVARPSGRRVLTAGALH